MTIISTDLVIIVIYNLFNWLYHSFTLNILSYVTIGYMYCCRPNSAIIVNYGRLISTFLHLRFCLQKQIRQLNRQRDLTV